MRIPLIRNSFLFMRARGVTFSMLACHGKGGWTYTKQYFCHHADAICHPNSSYVTTKLYETSACGCNNRPPIYYDLSERAIFTFPTVDVCILWPVIWAGIALRWLVTLVIRSYAYLLSNATEVLWRRSASCVASKRIFDLIHKLFLKYAQNIHLSL